MKVFVISLKNATERRASAVKQLEQANLDFHLFDAVEGAAFVSKHSIEINRRLYRLNTLREPLATEIGCYASHKALWRTCMVLDEPILILEDDFQLAAGFSDSVPVIKSLTETHGFIRLETCDRRRKPLKKLRPAAYHVLSHKESKLYYLSDVPLCMLAYAISPVAASSLVKASATLIAPVDKFLQQTWVHGTPIYALSPALVDKSSCAANSTIGARQRKSLNPRLRLSRALYKGLGELKRIGFDKRHLTGLHNCDS